jgi:hypothetical protein
VSESVAPEVLEAIAAAEPRLLSGVAVGPGRAPGEPDGAGRVDDRAEPVYDEAIRRDIQGSIGPGFNKDHQHFLFLRVRDRESARRWVAEIAPSITSMDEALGFVREYRARRLAEGVRAPAGLTSTWVNIAFSYCGIATLAGPEEAEQFCEESFHQGLAARSTHLGDPTSPESPGHRDHWVVGGLEFLTRRWSNSPIQPNEGGHDLMIGQRDTRGTASATSTFRARRGRRCGSSSTGTG